MRKLLNDRDLRTVSIIPDLFVDKVYGRCSYSCDDTAIRRGAIDKIKCMCDIAGGMKCQTPDIWNRHPIGIIKFRLTKTIEEGLHTEFVTDKQSISEKLFEKPADVLPALKYCLQATHHGRSGRDGPIQTLRK